MENIQVVSAVAYAGCDERHGQRAEKCEDGWGQNRSTLRSLLDIMRTFELHPFCYMIRSIGNVASFALDCSDPRQQLAYLDQIHASMETLERLCEKGELRMTMKSIGPAKRMVELQREGASINFSSIARASNIIATRLEDELSLRLFFELEPQQAERFQSPLQDWDLVISRFGKARQNVEECSKCFALERYGAAVFHVLLVAEFGVIEIAKLLQVEGDKPGWASLKRLQDFLKASFPNRTPLAQKYSKLLEDVVPLAIIVKDSWRHKLTHVDNQIVWMDTDFSPQVAEEIIAATRGFMRKLAQDLPQETEE